MVYECVCLQLCTASLLHCSWHGWYHYRWNSAGCLRLSCSRLWRPIVPNTEIVTSVVHDSIFGCYFAFSIVISVLFCGHWLTVFKMYLHSWRLKCTGRPSVANTHTHTHTRLTALYPGLPGWAGTRKEKPIWIYWSKRQWVAVASAGPYASLHLAPVR